LILAGAIVSIVLNPLTFAALDRSTAQSAPPIAPPRPGDPDLAQSYATGHAVIVGYGMVGRSLAETLRAEDRPFLVIDDREEETARRRADGVEALCGNAAETAVLEAANVAHADRIFVAIPNVFEAGQVIEKARKVNPDLRIDARAENEAERAHLVEHGARSRSE